MWHVYAAISIYTWWLSADVGWRCLTQLSGRKGNQKLTALQLFATKLQGYIAKVGFGSMMDLGGAYSVTLLRGNDEKIGLTTMGRCLICLLEAVRTEALRMGFVDLTAATYDCTRNPIVVVVSRRLQADSRRLDVIQATSREHHNFRFPTKASSAGARCLAGDPLPVVPAISEIEVAVLAIAAAAGWPNPERAGQTLVADTSHH